MCELAVLPLPPVGVVTTVSPNEVDGARMCLARALRVASEDAVAASPWVGKMVGRPKLVAVDVIAAC